MDALRFVRGVRPSAPAAGVAPPPPPPVASVPASPIPPPRGRGASAAVAPAPGFHSPLLRLWPRHGSGGGDRALADASAEAEEEAAAKAEEEGSPPRREGENWVLQILRVQSRGAEHADAVAGGGARSGGGDGDGEEGEGGERCVGCSGGGGDEGGCAVEEEEEEHKFDRVTFSRLLRKVPLAEAKVYSKMSYLCNFAYMVPRIKPKYLQKYNMQFVTSSVQEKAKDPNPHQKQKHNNNEGKSSNQQSTSLTNPLAESKEHKSNRKEDKENSQGISPFDAYQVAASAASYLQSQAMGVLPFSFGDKGKSHTTIKAIVNGEHSKGLTMDEAAFMATTNSMTSMVSAKEETRQAVADDLNSSRSCPCEWFSCDDKQSNTRYFVVQGSETIASWQANLLFEPIKFEGLNVLVHRGIYEAAKGIYQQMLPYVKSHLSTRGRSARLRFTGHSLGGSLALLVNLMLLTRGVAPSSSLLPVITFGAPSIICGGDYLLQKLGLPKSHVQSITMHRDIVPRAFSCNYPDHIASILRIVNGNFRSHPCLTNQKFLYGPMGKVIILQPDDKFSPHHHLLPPGSGLYLIGDSTVDSDTASRVLKSAMSAFFNSPHPLEVLGDSSAYGPNGTVYRDHDVHSYLRSVRAVVRKEMKAEQEQRGLMWLPIEVHSVVARVNRRQMLRLLQRHAHLLVVFLLPAKLLVLGVLSAIRSN